MCQFGSTIYSESLDWFKQHVSIRFDEFYACVESLWTRVDSYCRMAVAWRCAWYRLHYPLEFYLAYFHFVAKPQIREAVFLGKEAYLDVRADAQEAANDEMFEELAMQPYDVDCAVADEMYLRGIDLTNTHAKGTVSDAVIRLRDRLLPGQITILAGRPGMGKTALACDLISLSYRKVGAMPGYLAENEDAEAITKRIAARGDTPCIVLPSLDAFGLFDLQALPTPLLVIDFVPYDLDEDLREFFETMKAFAQGHQSSVLIVSQISRKADGRKDKRPLVHDLPVSMQNCLDLVDNVVFLYREDDYTNGHTGEAEAIFAKGSLEEETISLRWDANRASFL